MWRWRSGLRLSGGFVRNALSVSGSSALICVGPPPDLADAHVSGGTRASKVAIRSRLFSGRVYIRKDDLVGWLREEADDSRGLGQAEVARFLDALVDRIASVR